MPIVIDIFSLIIIMPCYAAIRRRLSRIAFRASLLEVILVALLADHRRCLDADASSLYLAAAYGRAALVIITRPTIAAGRSRLLFPAAMRVPIDADTRVNIRRCRRF